MFKRHAQLHQGDLWEFTGGKIEPNETAQHALQREFLEELDIIIQDFQPLISLKHEYNDCVVHLQVFTIFNFSGIPRSTNNQPLRWISLNEIDKFDFPKANKAILNALKLPTCYAICDDGANMNLKERLLFLLKKNIRLIQLRLKNTTPENSRAFLEWAYQINQDYNAILLVNSSVKQFQNLPCDGLHLTSFDLMRCQKRPENYRWLVASCHNLAEIQHAEKIGADFIVISPVLKTPSHPETTPLGWTQFSQLTAQANLPVYALGGLQFSDLETAIFHGAQGISGIRLGFF